MRSVFILFKKQTIFFVLFFVLINYNLTPYLFKYMHLNIRKCYKKIKNIQKLFTCVPTWGTFGHACCTNKYKVINNLK